MQRSLLAVVAVAAALACVPWLHLPAFYETFLYLVLHWIALATSWNLLSGYSGYFSFGHGAFFGVGMYATATLTTRLGVPFLWTLPVAGAAAALVGTVIGAIAFRVRTIRAELFSLLTLATTFVVATIVLNTPIDGGPGVYLSAVPVPALGPSPPGSFFLLALGVATLSLIVAVAVFHGRLGVGLFAIHDDEDVAEVLGVPTFRYKLGAFALSCALAGVVGGIHALFVSYVTTSETFNIVLPLNVVLMCVLGGTRHWAGPIVGATAITCLLYAFTGGDSAVFGKGLTGLVLIGVILFMPDGIVPQTARLWRSRVRPPATRAAVAPKRDAPAATAASPAVPTSLRPAEAAALPAASGRVLLRARSVRKSFAGVHALRGVDLELRDGEILGLLGPNGSGKSTFINVVSGHLPASGGSVELDGLELVGIPAHRVARRGISRTYQIPRPFGHLTVLENTALTAVFGANGLGRAAALREAWQWLEFTGLTALAHALPAELNLHQRKFLEFARALSARPRILMLDEVLSGLTPSEIDGAVALIRRIRDRGTTIVFVEHVMRAVHALCDRIVVLNQGEVLAEGRPLDVMQRHDVITAYLGDAAGTSSAVDGPGPGGTKGLAHA